MKERLILQTIDITSIEEIKNYLHNCKNHYPFIYVYSACLDLLQERTGMDRDEARRKYGLFTGEQWMDLLFN